MAKYKSTVIRIFRKIATGNGNLELIISQLHYLQFTFRMATIKNTILYGVFW